MCDITIGQGTNFLGPRSILLNTKGVLQLYSVPHNPAVSEADKKQFSLVMAKRKTSSTAWG